MTMRQGSKALVLILFFSISASAWLAAQKHAAKAAPKYDPASEVTLSGTVEEVSKPMCAMMAEKKGLHLTIKANGQSYVVHLGPASMLEEYKFEPKVGSTVEVIGAHIQWEGKDSILARRVVSGDVTVTLRDAQGQPVWSGHQH